MVKAKTLKLNPLQKRLLKKLQEYINSHIDRYADRIDEDVREYIADGFFKDEADFLAWEYFITHDCMNEKNAHAELKKLEEHLAEKTF